MDAQTAAIVAQLGREMATMQKKIATLERGARTTQLAGAVIDGDVLQFADDSGNVVHTIGLQPDGSVTSVSSSPNGPVQPSTPTVTAGTLGCVVSWDGLMSDGSAPLSDFVQTQIHISTTNGFIPDSTTLVAAITGPGQRAISNLVPGTTYYVVLIAFNASGIPSPASAQVSVVPIQVTGSFIANLTASLIGNLGVLNPNPYFTGGDPSGWQATNGSFNLTSSPAAGAAYKYAGVYANNGTGAGAAEGIPGGPNSSWFPVLPGAQVMVTAQVNTTVTSVQTGFSWYNSAGTLISSAGLVTTPVTANTWTQVTSVATAPAGTAFAIQRVGSPSGDNAVTQIQACLAMPQVPGSLVQAGTITASQIAAGVIVAGIVDGTIITGAQFISHGATGNMLNYSGTPALGNLESSVSPTAFTDSFGNSVLKDITAYGASNTYVQMNASTPASFRIGSGEAAETTPAIFSSAIFGSGGPRFIQTILKAARVSGQDPFRDASITIEGDAVDHSFPTDIRIDVSSSSTLHSNITILDQSIQFQGSASSMVFIDIANQKTVVGYPIARASAAGGTVAMAWTTLSPTNGWANSGGGIASLQYLKMAQNEVWLIGVLNPASFTSTTIATLPSGFRPVGAAVEDSIEFHTTTGSGLGCFLRIGTSGTIQALNATTGMGVIGINTRIPLDTIT